jgi:hypothetical protein
MGKLITTTLLDAYDWYINCPGSWKEKALRDLTAKLTRTDTFDPSPAIKRGMAFEAQVCSLLPGSTEDFMTGMVGHSPDVIQFWEQCHGGIQQKKLSRTITVDGIDYYLSGKADIAHEDITIDIKTTADFRSADQYLKKSQHPLYITCRRKPAFTYLIACFDDERGVCEKVRVIDATLDVAVAEARIEAKIREFINFIGMDGTDLLQAYNTQFCKSW